MRRDLEGAVTAFTDSAKGAPDWLQLQHLNAYDLGFTHFFQADYEAAVGGAIALVTCICVLFSVAP
jgi:hypothetical protein